MSEPMSDDPTLDEIREWALSPSCCSRLWAKAFAEIDCLRAELAAKPSGEPEAWVANYGTRGPILYDKCPTFILGNNITTHGIQGCTTTLPCAIGECRPVFIGESIAPKPPLPEPVYDDSTITVFAAGELKAVVRPSFTSGWRCECFRDGSPFGHSHHDEQSQAWVAAAAWVTDGATP